MVIFKNLSLCILLSAPAIAAQDINSFVKWMEGTFSSEEQAEADSNYFNIVLKSESIWNERSDAVWLYVEQAPAESPENPYRQRVYKLSVNSDGTFESAVFLIPNEQGLTSTELKNYLINECSPNFLVEKIGCNVIVSWNENEKCFEGSTRGKECSSNLRGATYAKSDVKIYSDKLIAWDRGYDVEDNQVWGAVSGGYIFKRIENHR